MSAHAERQIHWELVQGEARMEDLLAQKERMDKLFNDIQKALKNGLSGEGPPDLDNLGVTLKSKSISEMVDMRTKLDVEINAPPRVRIFQLPTIPVKKDVKKQVLATIAAGLFGFVLVGLGVVGYESRIKRALSLEDVEQAILGPLVGVFPATRDGKTQNPHLLAEAVEKARSLLLQQYATPGSKVVIITSAIADEGKAFTAAQLAMSFTAAGTRTLLVDFDLRTPIMHEVLSAPNDRGVCDVLSIQASLTEAVQMLPNGMLLLSAGRWSESIRQMLTPQHIARFFSLLREHYDCVIMHTHPLLAVAETRLLAPQADAILLTIEKQQTRLPLAQRAQEKIASVAPESFGIVFIGANEDDCLR